MVHNNYSRPLWKRVGVLLLLAAVMLSGCQSGSTPTEPAGEAEYTITVQTQGGMPMANMQVYVYTDPSKVTIMNFGMTGTDGTLKLKMPQQEGYIVSIPALPAGYHMEDTSFTGLEAQVTLTSELLTGDLTQAKLGLGDVMYDFSVTTADGTVVTLSELLQEKEMVLLNFFFAGCDPCAAEFPYLHQSWLDNQDQVGVIVLDPVDTAQQVAAYQQEKALTFPMAACPGEWTMTFGISAYPTSIVIDRYGVICLVHDRSLEGDDAFTNLFRNFIGQMYQQKLYHSVEELA